VLILSLLIADFPVGVFGLFNQQSEINHQQL